MPILTEHEQWKIEYYGMTVDDVLEFRAAAASIAAINGYPTAEEFSAQLEVFIDEHLHK